MWWWDQTDINLERARETEADGEEADEDGIEE